MAVRGVFRAYIASFIELFYEATIAPIKKNLG